MDIIDRLRVCAKFDPDQADAILEIERLRKKSEVDDVEVEELNEAIAFRDAEIERLRSELDEARRGEHRENEHTPTWAELAAYWKARAEELETALSEIAEDDEDYRHRAYEYRQIARAALGEEKPFEDRYDNA